MVAYNRTPENEIKRQCESIGFFFVDCVYGERSYVKFICEKHDYKGVQIINREALLRWVRDGGCKCALVHRDTEDLRREPALDPNVEILGEYVKSSEKILCGCKKCGHKWKATPNKLKKGEGCPECKFDKVREKTSYSNQEYIDMLKERQPDLSVIGIYKGMRSPIRFKCNICGKEQICSCASRVLSGERGCSYCKSSRGEREIAHILNDLNVAYIKEFVFDDCKSKRPLRFDFYLPDNKLCIEFQGEQHYFPVDFTGKRNEEEAKRALTALQQRDRIKENYCAQRGIQLLAIPYWEKKHLQSIIGSALGTLGNKTVETVISQ